MIEKSTLDFLTNLTDNNNREWFLDNKLAYEKAKANFVEAIQHIIEDVSKLDKGLKGLDAKKCVFRINRDIRFSANKLPYKNNFGASFSAGGKNSNKAGYYLHLESSKAFVAVGKWMPEPIELAAIRQEIDYHSKEFKKLLSDKEFKAYYGDLSAEDKLKTAPKGYPKDHPELEILKLKSFVAVCDFKRKDILDKTFLSTCIQGCKIGIPLNAFLNRAIG